jgi:D-alanyl-D-alanine carboxypeptidase (penicillin-binding protein 5/6)
MHSIKLFTGIESVSRHCHGEENGSVGGQNLASATSLFLSSNSDLEQPTQHAAVETQKTHKWPWAAAFSKKVAGRVGAFVLCLFVYSLAESATRIGDAYAQKAKEVILMDYETGTVLYEKNADTLTSPSSMTKIMSVYLAFERLKDGRLTLHSPILISPKAWKTGGTRMFLDPNTYVPLEEILRGIIIQSGNDASVALAESLGGTEENFAHEMTEKAHALGAKDSIFRNAHGLFEVGHVSTVRDLALIARSIIKEFPQYYPYFGEISYSHNGITQINRNPLLSISHLKADGLKTGRTDEGGYGLVGSAEQNGRRLIVVVNGLPSEKERATVSEQLLSWGFRDFETKTFPRPDTPVIAEAKTWLGVEPTVGLTVQAPVTVILDKSKETQVKVEALYQEPLEAPLPQGQIVGTLIITLPDQSVREVPLVTTHPVALVSPFQRILSAFNYIVWGHS